MQNYLFGKFISKEWMKNVPNFEYASTGWTFIDKKMYTFWNYALTFVPLHITPSTISVIGLFTSLLTYLMMYYFDQTLSQPLPQWTYFWFALGLFVYQTWDALDGAQERRTGSPVALDQLFDHGWDSFSCTIIALGLIQTLQLGMGWEAKLAISTFWSTFYISQLEEHHLGYVRTQFSSIGVTEVQFAQMGIFLGAFIFGPSFYLKRIVEIIPQLSGIISDSIELRDIIVAILVINSISYCIFLLVEIVHAQKSLYNKLYSFISILPLWTIIGVFWVMDQSHKHTQQNAALIVFLLGLLSSMIATKIITLLILNYNCFLIL